MHTMLPSTCSCGHEDVSHTLNTCRYFLEKLVGLTRDSVDLNHVVVSIFFLMGIHPTIFASLLIPSARSTNKVCFAGNAPARELRVYCDGYA